MSIYSWNITNGKIDLYSNQGSFYAEYVQNNKTSRIPAQNIKGLSEEIKKTSSVCKAFLENTYVQVSKKDNSSFSLSIYPRILGGGGGNSKPAPNDHHDHNSWTALGKEASEHAVAHTIGHAAAGPLGGMLVGLLHTGELGRSEISYINRQRMNEEAQPRIQNVLQRHYSKPYQQASNPFNFPSNPKPPFNK